MRAVAEGADVLAYGIARDLRDVQAAHPSWLDIGARRGRYKGHEQLPYFGAILTEAGRIAAGLDKRCTQCRDVWPADVEFFRQQPKAGRPNRLAPWCKACESARVAAKRAIAKATGSAA